jgi:ABC-type lipopolysaccharide export system ATPase subunit
MQLKTQVQEANLRVKKYQDENQNLKTLVSKDNLQELVEIKKERDALKKDNEEMRKFLKDYGLKWVGEGQHEG